MRVVLYAEGSLETGLAGSRRIPAPGQRLDDETLGAAHLIVRRCLCEPAGIDPSEIHYVAPLRVGARLARGSDLHDRTVLRRLLTWPDAELAPDLAVVLIDSDGDNGRLASLTAWTLGLGIALTLGVCVHEFESWLAADVSAVSSVVGRDVDELAEPQNLAPGDAKHWLRSKIGGENEPLHRRTLGQCCDLDRLRRQRSFEIFAKDLARRVT